MSDEGEDSRPVERRRSALQFQWGNIKFNLQGYSIRLILDLLVFSILVLVLGIVWDNRLGQDAQRASIAAGNAQIVAAIRYQTCIFALPDSEREREFQRTNGICSMIGHK